MAPGILPGLFISARRLASEERFATETISVPLLTLFALKALLDLEALNSNNVRGGTCLAEAGGAKKSGWGRCGLCGLRLGVVVAELLDKLLELGGHFGQLFSGHLGGSCS